SVMTAGAPPTQRHAPSDQRLDCSGIARSVSLPVPCRVPHLRSRSKYGFDVPAAIRDMKITLVVFLDQPVHKLTAKQRAELGKKNISFVFQQYHLLDNLTVAENLDIPLPTATSAPPSANRSWPIRWPGFRWSARRTSSQASCRAGSSNPRHHRQAETDPRRRAHRQFALRPGKGDHGAFQEVERPRG